MHLVVKYLISESDNDVKMTVAANGNVGIGTNNPSTKLHVHGNMTVGDGTTNEQDINFLSAGNEIGKLVQILQMELINFIYMIVMLAVVVIMH